MNRNKAFKVFIICLAIALYTILLYFTIDFIKYYKIASIQTAWEEEIYEKLQQSKDEGIEKVVLSDITPFEWDTAYIFTTAISEDLFNEKFGNLDLLIELTNSDISLYWCFLKDGELVYGYYASEYYLFEYISGELNRWDHQADHDIILTVLPGDEIKIYYLEGDEPE